MANKLKLVYYRGDGGFAKQFTIKQDGAVKDLTTISNVALIWWFKEQKVATPRQIAWTGTPSGSNNEIATFNVPSDFFNKVVTYECQIEVYQSTGGNLILHSRQKFLVDVIETSGVHTD